MDGHVHTCLSPCGDLDMHPSGLVAAAGEAGVDLVAVCDHNSAENVGAVIRAGRSASVTVIPGMEISTAEEVHVVAWLPDVEAALTLQSKVYARLPGENDPEAFGMQVVADEHGDVLGFNDRLLIGATTLSIAEVVNRIHGLGGLAVAAHVDREGFGILGQLGMIPEGLPLDAVEVSPRTTLDRVRGDRRLSAGHWTYVTASDAHFPHDVGRAATFLRMEEPTFDEVRKAIAGTEGRTVLGGGRPMEDLAMHILDIAQNGFEAGASHVYIELREDVAKDRVEITIRDNGRGMDPATLARAADPFFTTRTTRKVGLGISLLKANARATGGNLTIDSTPGAGTVVHAWFSFGHIDRQPVGDIETTLLVLLASHPEADVTFRHVRGDQEYEISTRDFRAVLEGEALASPAGIAMVKEAIRYGEKTLNGEAYHG